MRTQRAVSPIHMVMTVWLYMLYIDGLMEEERNSIANAMELRLLCINPSIWMLLGFFHL